MIHKLEESKSCLKKILWKNFLRSDCMQFTKISRKFSFSKFCNLLHKAEKLSVRKFLVEWISTVDVKISIKLAQNEAPVLREHKVCFKKVLTPAVRHLQRFECQGVDDSCRNFT